MIIILDDFKPYTEKIKPKKIYKMQENIMWLDWWKELFDSK